MSLDRDAYIDCLDRCMFWTPPGARGITLVEMSGVAGRFSPISMPYTNLFAHAPGATEVPDASLDALLKRCRSEGRAMGWLLGPNSPAGLKVQLQQRGLTRFEEFAGLVLEDLERPLTTPDDLEVREVLPGEQGRFADVLTRAFGLPAEMTTYLCDIVYFADALPRARNYFVFRHGNPSPLGVASTLYDPDHPFIVLGGSAILAEHRGHGAYRAMVRRRLEDARKEGIVAAVIQAVRATSAPICRNLGFEEICAQELYAWMP